MTYIRNIQPPFGAAFLLPTLAFPFLCAKVHLFTVIFCVIHERKHGENTAISALFSLYHIKVFSSILCVALLGQLCSVTIDVRPKAKKL